MSRDWFGPTWEFPSKRDNAYAINPTTDPRLTLEYTDHPRDNVNMTISYWDYDQAAKVTVSTEVWSEGSLVRAVPVQFAPGWNNWGLQDVEFDKINFKFEGKSDDWRDLLIIDELSFS